MRRRSRATHKYRPKTSPDQGGPEYPVASIAYYGPDDSRATKVVVGIIVAEDDDVTYLDKWSAIGTDVRYDMMISQQIQDFLMEHGVRSVVIASRIIGCPHEEGVDYPIGGTCPQCPFWAKRDRWTGELIH